MIRLASLLVLTLPLVTQGCLLDIAPARKPIDAAWEERMVAGQYGTWFYGEKRPDIGRDRIESSPLLAGGTRYGIKITDVSTLAVVGGRCLAGSLRE